jgi:hypothetical protein
VDMAGDVPVLSRCQPQFRCLERPELESLCSRVRGRENDIPKKRQTDVDQEISTTPSDCVDTDRRNYSTLASAIDGSMTARGLTKQGDEDQEYRRNHTHLAC